MKKITNQLKGEDVATCPTFHKGTGSACQWHIGRQLIEKEKILAFGYKWLVTEKNEERGEWRWGRRRKGLYWRVSGLGCLGDRRA